MRGSRAKALRRVVQLMQPEIHRDYVTEVVARRQVPVFEKTGLPKLDKSGNIIFQTIECKTTRLAAYCGRAMYQAQKVQYKAR